MRIGIIVTKDELGKQYVLSGEGKAVELDTTEIGALKDRMDRAVVSGVEAVVGKAKVRMAAGLLLTNNGLVKRKKFPVVG